MPAITFPFRESYMNNNRIVQSRNQELVLLEAPRDGGSAPKPRTMLAMLGHLGDNPHELCFSSGFIGLRVLHPRFCVAGLPWTSTIHKSEGPHLNDRLHLVPIPCQRFPPGSSCYMYIQSDDRSQRPSLPGSAVTSSLRQSF